MTRIVVYLLIFWAMQIASQLLLKWGSISASRWIWGFIMATTVGTSSVWLLMLLYKSMNANVAMGLGMGGTFLFTQIALFLVFETKVTPIQWAGIVAITIGMAAVSMGSAKAPEEGAATQIAAVQQE